MWKTDGKDTFFVQKNLYLCQPIEKRIINHQKKEP
jgi:hypothetical protein